MFVSSSGLYSFNTRRGVHRLVQVWCMMVGGSCKKVDNAKCPIKKVDNDAICPINLETWKKVCDMCTEYIEKM